MNDKYYNSQRSKLVLPEYGRHIHYMAKSLKDIEDREERNQQAHAVIAVMGNLNSQLRDTSDFRHKLWDHLFIMAGFDLDVDSPYAIPSDEALMCKPQKLCYPSGRLTYKQYGNNIRRVINLIKDYDEDVREIIALDVSKFMKFKSFEYNQEYPSDEVIINDIKKFSDGVIALDDDSLNSTKIAYRNSKTVSKGAVVRGKRVDNARTGQRTVKYGAGFKKSATSTNQPRRFYNKTAK